MKTQTRESDIFSVFLSKQRRKLDQRRWQELDEARRKKQIKKDFEEEVVESFVRFLAAASQNLKRMCQESAAFSGYLNSRWADHSLVVFADEKYPQRVCLCTKKLVDTYDLQFIFDPACVGFALVFGKSSQDVELWYYEDLNGHHKEYRVLNEEVFEGKNKRLSVDVLHGMNDVLSQLLNPETTSKFFLDTFGC